MPTRDDCIRCCASISLCLLCCGCPRPDGGDPEVWHDISVEGSAEILSVSAEATPSDAELTMQFTYAGGRIDEKPLEHVRLASIGDLPDAYQPQVGDTLRLKVDVHYKGKMSVGPPDFLHSKVDKRTFTCLDVVEADSGKQASAAVTEKNSITADAVTKLVWQTTGGGQIRFTVTPEGDEFKIHVDKFGPHQPLDMILTTQDGQPYTVAKAILANPHDFRLEQPKTPVDPNTPQTTGTWTSIYLIESNGAQIEINPSKPGVDFRSLYDLVHAAAETHDPPIETIIDLEPPQMPVDADDNAPAIVDESRNNKSTIKPVDAPAPKPTNKFEIEEMRWVTNGGGQIDFTIAPDGDSFEIRLKSRNFGNQPLDLKLTSDNGEAFQLVHAIFSKQRDLKHQDTIPAGVLTGTWTTITLVTAAGQRAEFKNISNSDDLHAIYEFVDDAARKANGEEPRPIPDYGTNE